MVLKTANNKPNRRTKALTFRGVDSYFEMRISVRYRKNSLFHHSSR